MRRRRPRVEMGMPTGMALAVLVRRRRHRRGTRIDLAHFGQRTRRLVDGKANPTLWLHFGQGSCWCMRCPRVLLVSDEAKGTRVPCPVSARGGDAILYNELRQMLSGNARAET